MPQKDIYALPNVTTPGRPVIFNAEICNGCNHCVEVCQIDVLRCLGEILHFHSQHLGQDMALAAGQLAELVL